MSLDVHVFTSMQGTYYCVCAKKISENIRVFEDARQQFDRSEVDSRSGNIHHDTWNLGIGECQIRVPITKYQSMCDRA